jgi:transposase-like protein
MGKGILNAVAEVFPGTPDFICHFHFLRDIGKDLLNNDYIPLQKRLRKLKVRPTLRRRAKYLEQKINPDCHDIGEINLNNSARANRPFIQLYKAIKITVEDNRLNELAKKLEAKIKVFDKLRCAMRIALPESKNGINDNGDVLDMKSIEEKKL